MPQSLVKNYVHITFSTKNRSSLIVNSIKEDLFNYLGGTCNKLESQSIIVGGTSNHVHLLVNLSRKMALMTLGYLYKFLRIKIFRVFQRQFKFLKHYRDNVIKFEAVYGKL